MIEASWSYVAAAYRSLSLEFVQAIPERARRVAVGLHQGVRVLALCRVGGLQTVTQIASAHRGVEGAEIYKEVFPCCGERGEGETTKANDMLLTFPCYQLIITTQRHRPTTSQTL